jgi:hypothetical protein
MTMTMMRMRLSRSTTSDDNVGGLTRGRWLAKGGMSMVIDVARASTEKRN